MAQTIGGKRQKKAAAAPPPRDAKIGDNSNDQAAIHEAEANMLLSFVHRIKAQKAKTAKAKEAYDAENTIEKGLYKLAESMATFTKAEINDYLDKLKQPTAFTATQEDRRTRHYRVLSIPTGTAPDQPDLFATATEHDDKALAAARMDGRRAYYDNRLCQPPPNLPGERINAWTEGWHEGETATAQAMKAVPLPSEQRKAAADAAAKAAEKKAQTPNPAADPPKTPEAPEADKAPGSVPWNLKPAEAMERIRALREDGLVRAFSELKVPVPQALINGDRKTAERKLFEALGYDMQDFDASPAELKRAGEARK